MSEVSCRAARMLLEAAADFGVAPERVVAGLPTDLVRLRDPRGRLDWDTFVALNDRLETLVGAGAMVEVGQRMARVPAYEFLRRVAGWGVSVRRLHRLGARWVWPGLFPHLPITTVEHPDGRLVVTVVIPPPYRGSAAFLRVCHGSFSAVPTLVGAPPAEVDAVIEPRRAVLTVRLPPAPSLRTRLRGALAGLAGAGATVEAVTRQHAEVRDSAAAMARTQAEFHALLERLPDGVCIHRDGRILWANEAMLRLSGLTRRDQAIGRHLLDFVPPERRPIWDARIRLPLGPDLPPPPPADLPMLRTDGVEVIVEVATAQVVQFDGRPARLVVCRDVTERKHLHEQLALVDRMASLGTVAAGVAHEINNPLAYAQLHLEILARELVGAPPRAADALAATREGIGRVSGIVGDLRTLSRGHADAVAPVDVTAALEAALRIAAKPIAERARLVRAIAPVPPARGNPERLGQVFLNLLLNAAEAIPHGGAAAHTVTVRTGTDAAGRVVVDVSDTGPGIPEAIRPRIFEPFFTTKPPGEGTGLGLAICHRIVLALGGELSVAETSPRGTTFRVALPPASPAMAVASRPPAAPAPSRRGRLLIVDDEARLREALASVLADRHDVVAVAGGAEALALLRHDAAFDVVLCDLMMAGVTGMDVYETLRASGGGLDQLMIFMTGGAFTPRARAFLADVPNPALEKPFDLGELLALIGERLEARSA